MYRKPTCTDQVIHASSKHAMNQKLAAFHCMLHRALSIPLEPSAFNSEIMNIKKIACANGYSEQLIDDLLASRKKKLLFKEIYSPSPSDQFSWRRIKYLGEPSIKIGNMLKVMNIKPAFYNNNNLKSLLPSVKDPLEPALRRGVYQLQCGDCDAKYIGQTGRSLRIRAEEHRRDYKKDTGKSHFANHLVEEGHRADFTPELLHRVKKGTQLDVREQLEILKIVKRKEKITNDHLIPFHSSLLDIPLLHHKNSQ